MEQAAGFVRICASKMAKRRAARLKGVWKAECWKGVDRVESSQGQNERRPGENEAKVKEVNRVKILLPLPRKKRKDERTMKHGGERVKKGKKG